MDSQPRLWTANFLLLSVVNFCVALVFYLLVVITGGFATARFGASLSEAGLAVGIFIVGAFAGRLLVGQVIDRWDRRRTLIASLLAFSAMTGLYVVVEDVALLILLRFVHGVAIAIGGTAVGAMIALIIPDSRKAEGIGYYSLSTTIATAIGPFLGLWMMRHGSYDAIFWVATGFTLFGAACAFVMKLPARVQGMAHKPQPLSLRNMVEWKAAPIAMTTLMSGLCYSSVLAYIQVYAVDIGLVEAASLFFVFYSVAIMLSRPWTGRIMDRHGANVVVIPCVVALSLGFLTLGLAHHGAVLLLAGALIGLGFGNIQSATQAIAIKVADPQRMGLATSTYFIFLDAGLGFGPYFLGYVIPLTGYRMLYVGIAGLALVTGVVYWVLHGRRDAGLWRAHHDGRA